MSARKKPGRKVLTKAQILGAKDITIKDVEVPEWGGVVRLRSLDGDEAIEYVQGFKDKTAEQKEQMAVRIVTMCAIDDKGERLFEKDDIGPLRKKSFAAIIRLQKVALEINGMSEDEEEETAKG